MKGGPPGQSISEAKQALIESADKAADKGIIIHGINYGKHVKQNDNDLMREVAEKTEGKFYYAPNNQQLKIVYADIASKSYVRLTYVH